MASFSQTTIVGNCTRDPELKTTSGGTSVANFGVAVNKKIGGKEKVSYYSVALFGKTAEVAAKYLKRGASVLISGEMEQDRWEKDGQKREAWVLNGFNMQLLSNRSGEQSTEQPTQQGARNNVQHGYSDGEEEVPF